MSQIVQLTRDEQRLSRDGIERFAEFVTTRMGIKMPEAKFLMLYSRISKRMRQLGLATVREYEQYLFNSPDGAEELIHFMDAVTTNKTCFFREAVHFEYLCQTALPGMLSRTNTTRHITGWSAGCSTGEEPYTIAMALSDFGQRSGGLEFQILATDISSRVLDHASRGIYGIDCAGEIPQCYRSRYLLRDKLRRRVRVVPELRRRVSFHRLNLMDERYPITCVFDFIFFRNVMIYFSRETQEQVINKLCRHLREGGYLFVGHAESLAGFHAPLNHVAQAVFRKHSESKPVFSTPE